jgi:hypothetical protein
MIGIEVIDVVEGKDMDEMERMKSFISGRKKNLKYLENEIEWCVSSGKVRNVEYEKV